MQALYRATALLERSGEQVSAANPRTAGPGNGVLALNHLILTLALGSVHGLVSANIEGIQRLILFAQDGDPLTDGNLQWTFSSGHRQLPDGTLQAAAYLQSEVAVTPRQQQGEFFTTDAAEKITATGSLSPTFGNTL